ncbi:MAG: right-handed parallel beta-helix repeat-containing protein [Oscillospiraceae bacterium]|nr:right-handed parallel beta-helix repeat-containing protein [Oscillospiraceae bacterium]
MIYYVDNVHGHDGNEGTSAASPWKSIEKVHAKKYEPGDEILFIRGGCWQGMLSPVGDGAKGAPVIIGAYGDGPAPWIDGAGAQAAIKLEKVDFWTVRGIRCTNAAPWRFPRCGIMVLGRPVGVTRGIRIENCEVSNVTGENRRPLPRYRNMYNNSGIYVTFPYRCTAENHLDDIVVENNHVHDVLTSGVRVNQEEDGQTDIFHTNIVLRGNLIERTGTDGIIMANSIKPLIEYNRCYDAGALGVKDETIVIAGVWCCACSDATFQYNEVARTRLFHNDGTAFDTD